MRQVIIVVELFDLLFYLCLFLIWKKTKIKLITKTSGKCHISSCRKRYASSCLVIWACRYMCTNWTDRIEEWCSILDIKTVHSICIVTAPNLWRIVQHSGIETSATAAAALKQNLRETLYKTLQQLLNSKYIAVIAFAWLLTFVNMAVHIADTAVHIPLYILDLSVSKNFFKTSHQIVAHITSCHIKHKLIAGMIWHTSWNCDCPVWMSTVKITVLWDHLWLKPKTKFHTLFMDLLWKLWQTSANLFFIDKPVTKATVVLITLAKPTIIKHHHLNAKLSCLRRNLFNLLFIEIKICCLPVINQNWTALMLITTSAHMLM